MTKQEYDERLAVLKKEYDRAKDNIAIEYAKSNNPYIVGDILSNDRGVIIRVDKIAYRYGIDGMPYCSYSGIALKKDLTPRKTKPFTDTIYQSDKIIKLN